MDRENVLIARVDFRTQDFSHAMIHLQENNMRFSQLFGATLVLILMDGVASAADCHVDHYDIIFGTDTSTHMTVRSGKSCGSTIVMRRGSLQSLAVAQSPQSGIAAASGFRWEYKSKPGFSGKDAFIVQGSGEQMGNRGVHRGAVNISVDVDVVQ